MSKPVKSNYPGAAEWADALEIYVAELEADKSIILNQWADMENDLAALREALTDERRLTNEATASRKRAETELAAAKRLLRKQQLG